MIDSVGYTEDGMVWMNVLFTYDNEPIKMVVTMSQDQAREVGKHLSMAADKAHQFKSGG